MVVTLTIDVSVITAHSHQDCTFVRITSKALSDIANAPEALYDFYDGSWVWDGWKTTLALNGMISSFRLLSMTGM